MLVQYCQVGSDKGRVVLVLVCVDMLKLEKMNNAIISVTPEG